MIYFCIPAYNEERTVGVVLWKLRQVMAELNRDYQIIVVDDASTDSTPAVLSPYIRVLPLTVIRNSERRGYADALEVALREAVRRAPYPKRDAIIVLQGDFTEDPDVVTTLVKKIEAGADIVATDVEIEEAAPRTFRWGRKLFRWLLRGKEWAVGDALSGLRAYRVVTLKRALDGRGNARVLSWDGWGANAELISLAQPHSRRTDVVETTLKHHRHQRDSRFSFWDVMREVRGAATTRPNAQAHALPTDGVVAAPLPIAVEQAAARQQYHKEPERGRARGRGRSDGRGDGRGKVRAEGRGTGRGKDSDKPAAAPVREVREARPPRPPRPGRPPRPEPAARSVPVAATEPGSEVESVEAAAVSLPAKKRRRPRRKKPRSQQSPALAVEQAGEQTEAPAEVSSVVDTDGSPAGPKKKSRRGRRGGRGRRRGPRADGASTDQSGEGSVEAPPPLAAEGD